jgi:Ni/Co efflux regulator RcnB
MKKGLLALAAGMILTAPLASAGSAWAQSWGGGGHDGGGGHRGNGGHEGGGGHYGNGGHEGGGGFGGNGGRPGNGGYRGGPGAEGGRGGGWQGGIPDPGPGYRGQRWDDRRNNGYWTNNRWHYGPPPQDIYGRPGFALGFSDWRRGGYLPEYYRGWVVDDYPRWGLRRPPYGYHWVRVGPDYLLVAAATGLIFDVVRP